MLLESVQTFDGLCRVFFNQLLALLQSVKPDESIFLRINAGGLPEFLSVTNHIQHVIPDLKRETKQSCEFRRCPELLFTAASGDGSQAATISFPVFLD